MKIFFSICVYNVEKYGSKCIHKSGKKIALTEIFTVMWSKTSVLSN